jgi:serine/threonine-protein kinase RsbW
MPTFAGTLDSLEPIRVFVGGAAERAGLDSSAAYKLCLAVDEVASNVVVHGYEEAGRAGDIDVEAAVESGVLVVRMADTSEGYVPDAHVVTEDELAAPLETREPGGLGLFLVRDSVDEFTYERIDGRNVHRFGVRLP